MNEQELSLVQKQWQNLKIQNNLNGLDATKVSQRLEQLYQQTFQKTTSYSRIAVCLENNSRRRFLNALARIFSDSIRQQLQAQEASAEESYPGEKSYPPNARPTLTSHVLPQTKDKEPNQRENPPKRRNSLQNRKSLRPQRIYPINPGKTPNL